MKLNPDTAPSARPEFLLIADASGTPLLTLDITENGVTLEYDDSRLPEIIKAADDYARQNVGWV